MVQTALTDQVLKRATPAHGQRLEFWDAYIEGFGYRASQPGKGSFFVMFRLDGKQRRMTIGRYPIMKLADARVKATDALRSVKENRDPKTEEADRLREEGERRSRTMALAIADYEKLYSRHRPATQAEVSRVFKRDVLPTLGARPVSSITRKDIARIVNAVSDRGAGVMANRLLAYLGSLFTWLVERGELESTPIVNLAMPTEERSRDRVLTDDELRAVWLAAEGLNSSFGRVAQLLILTGQRRDEVAGMRRQDLNLTTGLWTLPRELTKADRRHEVPLSPLAQTIITQSPDGEGDMIFPPTRIRKVEDRTPRHISGWSAYKATLNQRTLTILQEAEADQARKEGREPKTITLTPFTLHDLRRTFTSGLARLGIAPHVVERLLNHSGGTIRGVAGIYNRHSYGPEMRHAVDFWAQHIAGLTAPVPSNLVSLARAG